MWILDTSVLLQGVEPPPGARWTTEEVASEVREGGRQARRWSYWEAAGLEVRAATSGSHERVRAVARQAGNLERLSRADVSVLALGLDAGADAVVLSDDKTLLDVARRLGVRARAVREGGIEATVDWRPRCTGCGRWFDAGAELADCPVCGSGVRARPHPAGR